MAVGMGCDEGLFRNLDDIPKASIIKMGNVEQHPLFLHTPDGLPAEVCKTVILAGERARAEVVCLVPGQYTVAAAELIIAVDPGKVLAHRRHALYADKDIYLAVGIGLHHLVIAMDDAERPALGSLCLYGSHDLLGTLYIVHVIRRVYPNNKNTSFNAALAETLQMAAIKYVRLAIETASSHITPDIRVCIKIHSFAFRKITGANLFKRCAGVILSLQNSRLCQKLMRRRG